MLAVLKYILWPIIETLRVLFGVFDAITGSAGLAIILLCLSVQILLLPLQRRARRVEDSARARSDLVASEVQVLKRRGLKGEKLFFETEQIYEKHNYHPIQSLWQSLSIFILLPVLVSALILFTEPGFLAGRPFLFIDDLSKMDGLAGPVNILPLIMSAVTVVDANIRFRDDTRSKYRFYFIALVLLVLVYNLPASLVLFWTTANVFALALTLMQGGSLFRNT